MSLNVGILGHVDSGKTTLTRAMAEMASTAAFDKHADSGGRRNTLDLGFSSLTVSDHRLALIDCPGHAGLIKAVLAASSVFDMAIVVSSSLWLSFENLSSPFVFAYFFNKILLFFFAI
ncbi:unnamed protein product [Strongylus vulgaris]|uniref:Tr-type G domain-containing protein n=1 Tax=Strongylus vulgaris TaxID=40348 RepID=A0A3P7KCA5_STRVU|nr:unnamed protein product [Strongylus vulgaris]